MTSLRGQVELVAIAAVILIAIIAVILSLQLTMVEPPEGTGIEEEAKLVKESVNSLIRTGLKEQMYLIYNQGGMLDPPTGGHQSVEFGMFDVPYWQACDQVSVPDVESEIGNGMGIYIRHNLEPEEEFAKKTVLFDFSKMDLDVDIFKDSLRVRINLPTTIEDYSIPQPYEVTIPTKLYDILDFGRNFVNDNSQGRIFEGALLRCMLKFPTDPDSSDWLRPFGVLTGCGERIFKKKSDLLVPMRKAVTLSVTQTLWNEQPLRSIDRNCFTPVNLVGGKIYPDLGVYFEYPSSWDLDRHFFFSPNPVNIISTNMLSLAPVCLTPYQVSYNVRYPVVVHVEDSMTNQMFNFAVLVDINSTMPGGCPFELGEEGTDYTELCVNNANCQAKVTVKDREGNPVEGADVTYDICDVGRTDVNGVAEGPIPCGLAEIHVYRNGYRSHGDFLPASEMEDITVELTKIQDSLNIHFNGVPLRCDSPTGDIELDCANYDVIENPQPITDIGDLTIFTTFSPQDKSIWVPEDMDLIFDNTVNGSPVDLSVQGGLYPNTFDVSAFVTRNFEIMTGYFDSSFVLGENDRDIYVYMPVVTMIGDETINDSIAQDESEQLTTVLENCNILSVSTSPQTPDCI